MADYGSPGGTNPTHAIQIDTDSGSELDQGEAFHEFDSESDGGMQIDQPESILQIAGSEIEFDAQVMGLDRDESDFTTLAPNPATHSVSPRPGDNKDVNPPVRKRVREEDHAALAVLNDWELLVTYALNSHRTIPQTRRLFMAKLLAETPEAEDELYAARFVVPESKSELMSAVSSARVPPEYALGNLNSNAFLVPGAWKEVVSHDEGGWWTGAGGARGQQKRSVSGRSSRDGSRDGSGVD